MNLSISISQNSFHSSSYYKLYFSNFKLLMAPWLKGFPCGSAGKESACSEGDLGSIPGLGRSPEEGKGCPLQYSGLENEHSSLENSMDCTEGPKCAKELDTTERLSLSFTSPMPSALLYSVHLSPAPFTLGSPSPNPCLSLLHLLVFFF